MAGWVPGYSDTARAAALHVRAKSARTALSCGGSGLGVGDAAFGVLTTPSTGPTRPSRDRPTRPRRAETDCGDRAPTCWRGTALRAAPLSHCRESSPAGGTDPLDAPP